MSLVKNSGCLAGLLLVAACGGSTESGESTGTGSGDESVSSTGGEGVQNEDSPERGMAGMGWSPHAHGVRNGSATPHPDLREVYAELAPSVVIIRTEHGMGTGIVVGEGGLILTNNHVIADASVDDFELVVRVEIGAIDENGSMAITDEAGVEGRVVKRNPVNDLALIRLINPPAELPPVVALADELPTPGEAVTCLGHGNVGMLWSIRSCEVTATGRMEDNYARLHAVCASEDPMAQAMCQQMRDSFHRRSAGLVVQSSCVITPGDSGGPLLDDSGRLVGVNVFTMRNELMQTSSFHVHLREVREFMADIPDGPLRALPTPWLETPAETAAMDLDFDGRFDAIVMMGANHEAAKLIDLDQDTPDFPLDEIDEVVAQHRFDAEVGILDRPGGSYVWYDTDDDGRLDLLLEVTHQRGVDAAYRVAADGSTTEAPDMMAGPPMRPAFFSGASRTRYGAIFDGLHESHSSPGPVPAILRQGTLMDLDRNGTNETLRADRILAHAAIFDVDQNGLGEVQPDGVDALVRGGNVDVEVSVVRAGDTAWAYYDLDDDGTLETGFRSARNSPVIAEVLSLGDAGELTSEDFVGTMILRPALLSQNSETALQLLDTFIPRTWVAQTEDSFGLPDPIAHHFLPRISEREVRGWDHAVATIDSRGFHTILVDVDRDSFRGRDRRNLDEGIQRAVLAGHFSAEFAYVTTDQAAWAWYDTDHDGTWDIVIAEVRDDGDVVRNAFRRGEQGWDHDASLLEGKLVRGSLLRRNERRRFGRLASELFTDEVTE